MPKVSFRMASASRESVFGVQTSTARKNHRSGHTEARLTTTPSGCCVRKGTPRTPDTGAPHGPDKITYGSRCLAFRNRRSVRLNGRTSGAWLAS
jgi:hypothetical protein